MVGRFVESILSGCIAAILAHFIIKIIKYMLNVKKNYLNTNIK